MNKKYNLGQMMAEIQEDEKLDREEQVELCQDKIHEIMIERLRKRKALRE